MSNVKHIIVDKKRRWHIKWYTESFLSSALDFLNKLTLNAKYLKTKQISEDSE